MTGILYTGVEWNGEIRLNYVNLRKITFYLGGLLFTTLLFTSNPKTQKRRFFPKIIVFKKSITLRIFDESKY